MRRATKITLVRIVAATVPTLLGLAAITWLLVRQERLVIEPAKGTNAAPSIRLQPQPIYLEEPNHEITGHRYLYDETLGWRNIPGWKAATFKRTLTINSLGLRDREYPHAKPEGVFRILVLGDSFTWGYGISDDEIFTELLESDLNRAGHRVEVLNAGVSGWGTDQELLFLEKEGFNYEPDLVILAFYLYNDPENIAFSRQYGLNKPLFTDTNLTLANVPVPKPGTAAPDLQFPGNPLRLAAPLIARMARGCREHGARLLLMKFGLYMFSEGQPGDVADTKFRELIEPMTDVAWFDLDAELARRGLTPAQLKSGPQNHWDAAGHRHVAEALRDHLAAGGLFPGG